MSTVRQFCAECQQERKQFADAGDKQSPGCAGLWRLAVGRDNGGWACLQSIFAPWLTRLCGAAIRQAPAISGLSSQDLPDFVQDIWHNLWRYMARNPNDALALVADDDLSRVIALIKTTVKNRGVELCRNRRAIAKRYRKMMDSRTMSRAAGAGNFPQLIHLL